MPSNDPWALPSWADALEAGCEVGADAEQRMALAIELSLRNVEEATGGPFGAAVFDLEDGRLISVGVNAVVPNRCSHAHAEMVALGRAQRRLDSYDLSAEGRRHELVTSCEPCAMCFGAIPWSGIRRLVCGAADVDARAIGFDEGARVADWQDALRARGIEVVTGVCRNQARSVFDEYARRGGPIYNSRQD